MDLFRRPSLDFHGAVVIYSTLGCVALTNDALRSHVKAILLE